MTRLTEKKRKWVINQFKNGRSATSIARIQRMSRRYVYKLVKKFEEEGILAYKAKIPGRAKQPLNSSFVKKVIDIRKQTDYGSEKIHFVTSKEGFNVSQRQIQRILDEFGLTDPCPKRRGQRSYVRFEWPISNYMWHCDWTWYNGKWYITFIDDKSRRIMTAAKFSNANEEHTIFVFYQAILNNEVCPVVVLSDKGTQFYNAKRNKKGVLTPSLFEQELAKLNIEFWTSRRNHPQTNGKQEKWFDTLKKRMKKHPEESLQDFIKWYNEGRIHHSLSYKTPEEVYTSNV
jgi:transposase InsO family protein